MSLEIGTFCTALVVIPEEVSKAAYSQGAASQAPTSINNAADAQHTPRICYVSQKLPTPNEYLLHFVTSFDNSKIATQFYDHPERRNQFLAISPTASHTDEPPLRTFPATFSVPSYICLDPGVVVHIRVIRACRSPIPQLSEEEDARLQRLIRRLQRSSSTAQLSAPPESDSDSRDGGIPSESGWTTVQRRHRRTLGSLPVGEAGDNGNEASPAGPTATRVSLWLDGCSNDEPISAATAGYTEAFHNYVEQETVGWTPGEIAEGLAFLESYHGAAVPTVDVGFDFTACRRDEVDPCGGFLKEAAGVRALVG